jgi:DNA-binding CsgD family transcriptional regulator
LEVIKITPREFDVLVSLDQKEKDIMAEQGLSYGRYKGICNSLAKKFKAHSRTAIVIKALKNGIVKLQHFESYYD